MWRPSCSHFTHCAPRFDSEPPESRAVAGRVGVSMTSRGRRRARTSRRYRPRVTFYLCADYPRRHQPPLAETNRVRLPRPPSPAPTPRKLFVKCLYPILFALTPTPPWRHFLSVYFAIKKRKEKIKPDRRALNVLVGRRKWRKRSESLRPIKRNSLGSA